GGGNQRLGEGAARTGEGCVGLQDRLGIDQITGQIHLVDDVLLALGDVDGDVDLLVVRGDGDRRGVDVELHVAVVHVMGGQPLQVAAELLLGVFVAAAERPVPGFEAQLEQVQQLVILEGIVANDVDVLDAAFLALVHRHVDGDAVTRQVFHLDVHGGAVAAAGGIDLLDALTDGLERGAGEDATLGDVGRSHVVQNVVGLQHAVAGDIDLADRGTFQHGDVEDVAFAGNLDFLEVLRCSDRTDDLGRHGL